MTVNRSDQRTGARILFVTHAECRFSNMTVNQRIRALQRLGNMEILSPYPSVFPQDIQHVSKVRSFPVSRRLPHRIPKLLAFTVEAFVWSVAARMRRFHYDVIYCLPDTSAVVGMVLRSKRSGWVVDAVDDPAQILANAVQQGKVAKTWALRRRDSIIRFLLRNADLVYTLGASNNAAFPELLRTQYGAENVVAVNQAVDVAAIRSIAGPRLHRERRVIVYVGYISPLRGVDTLLAAAALLLERGLDFELRLMGTLKDDDAPWLQAAMQRHPGVIRYLGSTPSERTVREMRSATVAVIPFHDRREMAMQPITAIEYLALGTPVVASRLEGTASVFEDGVSGILVTPGDTEEMADAIHRILANPELARSLSEEALRRAEHFDIRHVDHRLHEGLKAWL